MTEQEFWEPVGAAINQNCGGCPAMFDSCSKGCADTLRRAHAKTQPDWVSLLSNTTCPDISNVEDVDFENRKIRLQNKKSRDGSMQARWLDMTDELADVLRRWLRTRPIKDSVWLFYVTDERSPHYGKPFTMRRRFLKGLCKRAGVKEMGYHALRRHVASFLAAQGAPLKFIQGVLGHADIKTTDRYIYNIIDDNAKIMNLLSAGDQTEEREAK